MLTLHAPHIKWGYYKPEKCFDLESIQGYHGVSFIGGGDRDTRRKPPTCRKSLKNFITYSCVEYTSPCTGFELTILVVNGAITNQRNALTWKAYKGKQNYLTLTSFLY
jgi:hypothetical protein